MTRNNDQVYKRAFDRVMRGAGITPKRLPLRSPNLHAYIERFIQTLQVECLDHFLVYGQKHFDYLVREFLQYYHEERPHQGPGNRLIVADVAEVPPVTKADQVTCESRPGALLNTYRRAA